MPIAKAKEIVNHSIGEVGLLVNPNPNATALDLSTGKLNFDAPPAGWMYYGLTTQETSMNTEMQMFESKVGVPEFTLKRFLIGAEGTVTGTFAEADVEIHAMLSGDGLVKNIGLGTAVQITVTTGVITVANADATMFRVGNTVVLGATSGACATSMNVGRITGKTAGDTHTTLSFADTTWRTTPTTGMYANVCKYAVCQIGSSSLSEVQCMLVYETREGVQFVYYLPKCIFTPNISPNFSSTSAVFSLPFEFKMMGVDDKYVTESATALFDRNRKVLGYFYELYDRNPAT